MDRGAYDLEGLLDRVCEAVEVLDDLSEITTLNHVAKHGYKSQGVVLPALYTKGFSSPTSLMEPMAGRDFSAKC